MSKITSLFSAPQPKIPEARVPAAPAPMSRTNTGATVVVGADAAGTNRVSGNSKGTGTKSTTGDVLGNLGRSGLSI